MCIYIYSINGYVSVCVWTVWIDVKLLSPCFQYCRGTQHVIGTVSNEATNDMGYQSWPLWRTCYLMVDDLVILLKHWSWGLDSFFSQAVCFTIMKQGTSSFMTSALDALVFVKVCNLWRVSDKVPQGRGVAPVQLLSRITLDYPNRMSNLHF